MFRVRRSVCLGSSGVGKTTLINRLLGQDKLDTREVSGTGEGVHTTSRRHLLVLDQGAMLIDTPGMRELGLLDVSEGIGESFAEIRDLSRGLPLLRLHPHPGTRLCDPDVPGKRGVE